MPDLGSSKFEEDPMKIEIASLETPFFHYKAMGNFLDVQSHLTPKGVVRSGRNSNLSEMSSLPANLTKIGSKLKALAWRHLFPQNVRHSRASNSEMNDPIGPEIKLIRDFTPILVTSKCDEDPIKNEQVSLETPSSHYKYMGNFLKRSRPPNPVGSGRT